jgi:hypothetical protein
LGASAIQEKPPYPHGHQERPAPASLQHGNGGAGYDTHGHHLSAEQLVATHAVDPHDSAWQNLRQTAFMPVTTARVTMAPASMARPDPPSPAATAAMRAPHFFVVKCFRLI